MKDFQPWHGWRSQARNRRPDDACRQEKPVMKPLMVEFQFDFNKATIGGPAPRVGEHTRDVLRDLGYDDGAIDKMVSEKSIRVAV
jgi:crotonobetainyl-CoA:carnitine CoA-transferase CaiB-like acyl-CoA transferase